jgi:glycosyltransferase involved in cell wall biosynthesis
VGAARCFDEVHVLSTINAGDFPEFIASTLGEYALHRLCEGHDAYLAAVATGELFQRVQRTIERIRPDAIATAGWTNPESIAALTCGRAQGTPVIVMSESQTDDAPRSFLREAVKRRVVSQFNAALVGGPTHADYAEYLGIPRDRIHYGYNAVDNDHFTRGAAEARLNATAVRARHGLPERYVLASSRFVSKKNLPSLVTAYSVARQRAVNAPDLVILGDGPERPSIEQAISRAGLHAHVHLPGFRGYQDLPDFYGLAEAFVHVSTAEQWGLVINEAMASGVPVIASDMCGAARTVLSDGVSGIITRTDTPAIANAFSRLFCMSSDGRTAMGRAATDAIADWGPERFGSGLMKAVESAMAAPRRGPVAPWDRVVFERLKRKVIADVA